ncbi:MAG: MFS transporter [Actinomycetota bacterium]
MSDGTTVDAAAEAADHRLRTSLLGTDQLVPLSIAHGVAAVGDAFVAISLAGSLFFSVSPDASRQQVLIYLLATMAPLAVLAPLVGPAVDRFRRSQRLVAAVFYTVRAVCCLLLVSTLLQLAFYPLALGLLVASKASGVVKQTLVQSLVDDPDELVAANARLARFASILAAVGAAAGAGVFAIGGAEWTLRCGAVAFAASAIVVTRVRPVRLSSPPPTDDIEYAETHLPTVIVGSGGMSAIRAAVGFFIFTLAFTLRRDSEPTYVYALAAGAYGLGAFIGHTAAALLRRWWREEQLIALAIAAPAVFTAIGILGASVPLLMIISALVGLSTTLGRNAFDALLQRRAPEALLGRAGARYETRFQLAWVFGGVLATPISLPVEVSMIVLTAVYVPALILFQRGAREARRHEHASVDSMAAAHDRLAEARVAWEAGKLRVTILDAVSAADLARSVGGVRSDDAARSALESLRATATDPESTVRERDALRSLQLAARLITPDP